jgi:hypothetical protein
MVATLGAGLFWSAAGAAEQTCRAWLPQVDLERRTNLTTEQNGCPVA